MHVVHCIPALPDCNLHSLRLFTAYLEVLDLDNISSIIRKAGNQLLHDIIASETGTADWMQLLGLKELLCQKAYEYSNHTDLKWPTVHITLHHILLIHIITSQAPTQTCCTFTGALTGTPRYSEWGLLRRTRARLAQLYKFWSSSSFYRGLFSKNECFSNYLFLLASGFLSRRSTIHDASTTLSHSQCFAPPSLLATMMRSQKLNDHQTWSRFSMILTCASTS